MSGGKRRKKTEDKNQLCKNILVACEGHKTEYDYLSCFENKHSSTGHFRFKNVKESFEMDNSDRHDLFSIIDTLFLQILLIITQIPGIGFYRIL